MGAGPARERVALATRQDPRDLYCPGVRSSVSGTRGSGTATGYNTPLTLQGGKLGISQGAPGSGVPIQDRVWPGMAKRRAYMDVLVACPGWAHPIPGRAFWRDGLSGEKSLWDPAGRLHRPFAGGARSHKGLTQTRVPSGGKGLPQGQIPSGGNYMR